MSEGAAEVAGAVPEAAEGLGGGGGPGGPGGGGLGYTYAQHK